MQQIEINPIVSIAGEWFTASGKAINMGYFGLEGNKKIADKMKVVFKEWIDNGHNNFEDTNTIILCSQSDILNPLKLKEGVLFSNGTRYEIPFSCKG